MDLFFPRSYCGVHWHPASRCPGHRGCQSPLGQVSEVSQWSGLYWNGVKSWLCMLRPTTEALVLKYAPTYQGLDFWCGALSGMALLNLGRIDKNYCIFKKQILPWLVHLLVSMYILLSLVFIPLSIYRGAQFSLNKHAEFNKNITNNI